MQQKITESLEKLALDADFCHFDNEIIDNFGKKFESLARHSVKPLGLIDCDQEKTTD